MRKFRKFLFASSTLILLNITVFSQNTGYLGSKVSIESTFNIIPSTLSIFGSENATFSQKINFNPNFGISLTTSQNFEIGFNYGIDKLNIILGGHYDLDNKTASNHSTFTLNNNNFNVNASFYDLVLRHYRYSGFIAPVGAYVQYIIGFCRFDDKDNYVNGRLSSRNDSSVPVISAKYKYDHPKSLLRVGLGIGKKTVLTKKMYLNIQANAYGYIGKDLGNYGFLTTKIIDNENFRKTLLIDKTIDFRIGLGCFL